MKNIINIIKCFIFLGAGFLLLFVQYNKIQSAFPKAPTPIVVKVTGVIVLICGIVIALMYSGM